MRSAELHAGPIRVIDHPQGPRVYAGRLRVHHGLVGLAAFAAGVIGGHIGLALGGAALVAHDWPDAPFSPWDGER